MKRSLGIFFVSSPQKQLNKLLSCRWFEAAWHSYDVTVKGCIHRTFPCHHEAPRSWLWHIFFLLRYILLFCHSFICRHPYLQTNSVLLGCCDEFILNMMTSSNGNIFRVTGPLCIQSPGEFPTQRPVTRSFDVYFDLRLNKRLSKQPWGWSFETLSWSLWRQCNETILAVVGRVYSNRYLSREIVIYSEKIGIISTKNE